MGVKEGKITPCLLSQEVGGFWFCRIKRLTDGKDNVAFVRLAW